MNNQKDRERQLIYDALCEILFYAKDNGGYYQCNYSAEEIKSLADKYKPREDNETLRNAAEDESLGKTLDEAANKFAVFYDQGTCDGIAQDCFKAGAEWMAGQGVTLKVTDDTTWGEVNDFIHRNCDGVKEIQIRKKED